MTFKPLATSANQEARNNFLPSNDDKVLTMREWVLNEWDKVGQRETAYKIITCESNWKINAVNGNTNKTSDLSLYQFNTIHVKSGFIDLKCLSDYKCQTFKAIEMWKKQGWTPWVCLKYVN